MSIEYSPERTRSGISLDRKNVKGKQIKCVEGNCAVDISNPSLPRERKWYLENVLKPGIEKGDIKDGSSGSYDDRKPRLDFVEINRGNLEVHLGITLYQNATVDIHRSPAELEMLRARGEREFKDIYAFLSRAPGVTAVPITSDKSVFLGQRIGTKEYPGFLNAVSGYVEFREDPSQTDLENEARRELNEEFGISHEKITASEFIGIFGNKITGEADFAFLFSLSLPSDYFLSRAWHKKARDIEHGPLIQIATYEDVQRLLRGETPSNCKEKISGIMYSTIGVLKNLYPEELQ